MIAFLIEPVRERIRSVEINAGKERYILTLNSEHYRGT